MQKQLSDILEIPIERVKPNPNNPRIIRDEKFMQLKKSLKEFPQMMVKFASKNVVINRTAWENTGWQFSQQIIWLKNSLTFSMGQDYHRIYEPCLFGWKKGKKHYKNKKLNNLRDCFHLDVADFKTIIDVWYEKRDTTNQYVHPTQKPLRLAERALKKSSKPGDNVVDFFGGSGSTMLSCHQMERNSFLCEIDPKFCDAIVRRFAKLMGESGKQFEISKNGKLINHTDYNVSH